MSIAKQILKLTHDRNTAITKTAIPQNKEAVRDRYNDDIAGLAVQLAKEHEQQIETLRAENTRLHELHLERTKLTTQVIDEKEELDKQLQAAQSELLRLKAKAGESLSFIENVKIIGEQAQIK